MKNNNQKLFGTQNDQNWNSSMYTSGLGVVKNSCESREMNSGFGTVKERAQGNEQEQRVFAMMPDRNESSFG